MCSIVILRQSDSEWPIIIGANRDEMVERESLPPEDIGINKLKLLRARTSKLAVHGLE